MSKPLDSCTPLVCALPQSFLRTSLCSLNVQTPHRAGTDDLFGLASGRQKEHYRTAKPFYPTKPRLAHTERRLKYATGYLLFITNTTFAILLYLKEVGPSEGGWFEWGRPFPNWYAPRLMRATAGIKPKTPVCMHGACDHCGVTEAVCDLPAQTCRMLRMPPIASTSRITWGPRRLQCSCAGRYFWLALFFHARSALYVVAQGCMAFLYWGVSRKAATLSTLLLVVTVGSSFSTYHLIYRRGMDQYLGSANVFYPLPGSPQAKCLFLEAQCDPYTIYTGWPENVTELGPSYTCKPLGDRIRKCLRVLIDHRLRLLSVAWARVLHRRVELVRSRLERCAADDRGCWGGHELIVRHWLASARGELPSWEGRVGSNVQQRWRDYEPKGGLG